VIRAAAENWIITKKVSVLVCSCGREERTHNRPEEWDLEDEEEEADAGDVDGDVELRSSGLVNRTKSIFPNALIGAVP
jgi:hypothetical protein